jgi:hypothetical protein
LSREWVEEVRVLQYACLACGHAETFLDVFLDLHRRPGEDEREFARRSRALAEAVRQVHGEHVEVVLAER